MNILHTITGGEGSHRTPKTLLFILTLAVLLVHGYHPYSEDGGVYVAGIKYLLNPRLYPSYTPFVTEHLRFSLFAPFVATLTRGTHLPLPYTLLLLYLTSTWLTLYAAWRLTALTTPSPAARTGAVTLLALWITLPIAGTSLLLADPYLTARSLTTPLGLLALTYALARRPLPCLLLLAIATPLHPLMAAYSLATILILLTMQWVPHSSPPYRDEWIHLKLLLALTAVAVAVAGTIQLLAPTESPTYYPLALSRYYWFPFWWQWYEQLGLVAPLAILYALRRRAPLLARTAAALALISLTVALCFCRVHLHTHLVARLQPLRCYQTVYLLMILLLGAWLGETLLRAHPLRWLALILVFGPLMVYVQRQTYPTSPHLELPWTTPTNPWVEAFLWARTNTPTTAVFALDARYVNAEGEDAQCFRAIAERSALPDYSKDGGEAAITPSLAASWEQGRTAQSHLNTQSDQQRRANLKPLGATWIILPTQTPTAFTCPYTNETVKLCRLP